MSETRIIIDNDANRMSQALAMGAILGVANSMGLYHLMPKIPKIPKRYSKPDHVPHQGNKERARRLKARGQ